MYSGHSDLDDNYDDSPRKRGGKGNVRNKRTRDMTEISHYSEISSAHDHEGTDRN